MDVVQVGGEGGQGKYNPANVKPERSMNGLLVASTEAQLQDQREQSDGSQNNDGEGAAQAHAVGVNDDQREDSAKKSGDDHGPAPGLVAVGQVR